jgi:hypothetical protein
LNLAALTDGPTVSRLPQRVWRNLEGKWMNFEHNANMGRVAKERQWIESNAWYPPLAGNSATLRVSFDFDH